MYIVGKLITMEEDLRYSILKELQSKSLENKLDVKLSEFSFDIVNNVECKVCWKELVFEKYVVSSKSADDTLLLITMKGSAHLREYEYDKIQFELNKSQIDLNNALGNELKNKVGWLIVAASISTVIPLLISKCT